MPQTIESFPAGITTVGVELEGYWERLGVDLPDPPDPEDCEYCVQNEHGDWDYCCDCYDLHYPSTDADDHEERNNRDLKYDGSVECDGSTFSDDDYIAGEAASPILQSWSALKGWVHRSYPDGVDARTGMHVHLGCSQGLHDFSFDPNYWGHLRHTLREVGEGCTSMTQYWLENRLREGRSSDEVDAYCRPNRINDRWSRYLAVNYSAFEQHGTLEVRVCPMAEEGRSKDGTHLSARTQALALIKGVLRATSDYWTTPSYWTTRQGTITTPVDMTLGGEDPKAVDATDTLIVV